LNFHELARTLVGEAFNLPEEPMPVQRLNHAVLFVRDVDRSVAFYTEALGFRVVRSTPGRGAFLQAAASTNDHDLALFAIGNEAGDSRAGTATVGLYHLAWEVDTLAELKRIEGVLVELGALVGASDHGSTKALYAHDPDGLEFEVSWLVPADRLTPQVQPVTAPLDLDAEIARYGAETLGGVGVSVPA
jgi:catechol-2,3-dioxygenase